MMVEHMSKYRTILLIGFVVVIMGGLALLFSGSGSQDTQETGGSENNQEASIEGWVYLTEGGISYEAPRMLSKKYFSAIDWPPSAQVVPGMMTCNEAGQETTRAGETELRKVSGVEYCVTTVLEGAAGNIYSQYAYAFQKENSIVTFSFATREIQCGNYDEEEAALCEAERQGTNLDELIHQIAGTVNFVRSR